MDKSYSLLDLLIILLREKKRIFLHFIIVTILATVISFLIPKSYKSTVLFLPPYNGMSPMSTLSLGLSLNMGGESPFTPQQIESLLNSRKILTDAVDKFDLIRVYKTSKAPNKTEKAIKALKNNIDLTLITESGLTQNTVVHYALSVIDKDRYRSAQIANYLIADLNQTMDDLSKNQSSYTLSFIKNRLDSIEMQKVFIDKQLSEFQKKNKIYSPEMKEQILASVSTYADLKKEKVMAEIKRNLLLFDKEKNNHEVLLEQAEIDELNRKMEQIENNQKPDVMPGLEYSVDIAQDYLKLVQEAEVLIKLELLLRQQYEEARIKNARQAPIVRVVDNAIPPEWKNSPKKALIVIMIVGVYMLILILSILLRFGFNLSSDETRNKLKDFKEALRLR